MSQRQDTEEKQSSIIYGRNAVIEAIHAKKALNHIYVTSRKGSLGFICAEAQKNGLVVKQTDPHNLDRMTGNANHQGVCAELSSVPYASIADILAVSKNKGTAPFLILCDGIEDPHNLGAILRTAEAAGADGVILPKRRSASLTQTVYKTSAGAASWIPVARVGNLATEMIALKKCGIWFFGTDMEGTDADKCDLCGGIGLVIGSEESGLSASVRAQCDCILSLPMLGHVNSLNASVAAGIFMYEAVRQRMHSPLPESKTAFV